MKKLLTAVSALILISCSQNNPINEAQIDDVDSNQVSLSSIYQTEFKQSNCPHKACQDYHITITDKHFTLVSNSNSSNGKLSVKQKIQLNDLLKALQLTKMNSKLTPGSKNCIKHRTESPSYSLDIKKGQLSQSLSFYGGCEPLPQRYSNLMQWFNKLILEQSRPNF